MSFEEIKKRYGRLSSAEIENELKYRTARKRGSYMVGSADCMIDAYVVRACREILAERK